MKSTSDPRSSGGTAGGKSRAGGSAGRSMAVSRHGEDSGREASDGHSPVGSRPMDRLEDPSTCSPTLLRSGGENWARCPVTSALLALRGGHVAEGTVGPDGIIVHAPGLDDLARVSQAEKPVLVQALVAEPAIETLDVGILIRLARVDEGQPNAAGVDPRIQPPGGALGSTLRDQ